jgi:mannose-6-phosphate isomerase-like protein (cupin superfamily)
MASTAVQTEQLWFLDTLVSIPVEHASGVDGVSLIESWAREGDSPPLHIHHTEDEIFHVIEGELRVRLGDEELVVGAGETVLAPRGQAHTYRVESPRARWLAITTRGDFERMVRALSRPAERSELPEPSGPPTPEQLDALAAACRDSGIELVGPPLT